MGNRLSWFSPRKCNFRTNAEAPRVSIPPLAHIVVPHPFPLEVWEFIITLLRSDGRSHAILSAVSRTLRAMVMPRYFQSVALSGRIPMERVLQAYDGLPPGECPVRDLLLTDSMHVTKDLPHYTKSKRPPANLPFSTLHHRLLRFLAPSLERLIVTYSMPMNCDPDYPSLYYLQTSFLPPVQFLHLRSLTAPAGAFNHFSGFYHYPLPHIPSLRRMHLFGSSLDHDSFDIMSDVAPELEELRIVHLPGNEHYNRDVGYLLGMDCYTRLRYIPSERRVREGCRRLQFIPFGGTQWPFGPFSSNAELFDNPPVLPRLRYIQIDQVPSTELDEIMSHSPGLVQMVICPFKEYDDSAVLADWQDTVLGGRGAWASGVSDAGSCT